MPNLVTTTKPGRKYRSLRNPKTYEALLRKGMSKGQAAAISNAQKSFTLAQLETFVSSAHYDAATAAAIAERVPSIPREKEQLAPGISRIHGNLCNVHGRYGPCDKGLAAEPKKPAAPSAPAAAAAPAKPKPKKSKRGGGKGAGAKKPKAGAKPKQTPDQKKAEQAKVEAENLTKVGDATDLGDYLSDLNKFGQGKPLSPQNAADLAKMGLVETGADGTPRQTAAGRAVVGAAKRGDVQGARDAASRGADSVAKQGERAARQQDAAGKRATAQVGRELAKRDREAAAKKRQAEAAKRQAAKKPAGGAKPPAKPAATAAPAKRAPIKSSGGGGGGGSSGGGSTSISDPKQPDKPKPEKAPAPSIAQPLKDAAQLLSDGAEMTDAQVQSLVRNGLAKLDKDGKPVLTSAGLNATKKDYSFRVFKDATGRSRWVAQSSTAFADRDNKIVSTKALADDCAFADETGNYGPLRWWHTPGLDLGDCDFNAMHGRVLIESGTFRSPTIAQKVAQAADRLEISLGFLHLPSEPDASGVFHHIRRFEDVIINGVTYKAFPLPKDDAAVEVEAKAPLPGNAAEDALDGGADDAMEEPAAEGGLTLSPEDLSAISDAVATALQAGLAQVMGAMDLEKKVAGHVQGLMAPFQTQKDAEAAQTKEQLAQLQQQVTELTGDQPAKPYRASEARGSAITDASLLLAAKAAEGNAAGPFDDIIQGLGLSRPQQ
jgi:hypothetical protein